MIKINYIFINPRIIAMTTDLNFTSTWAVDIKEYELNWAGKLVEAKHFNNEQEASTF